MQWYGWFAEIVTQFGRMVISKLGRYVSIRQFTIDFNNPVHIALLVAVVCLTLAGLFAVLARLFGRGGPGQRARQRLRSLQDQLDFLFAHTRPAEEDDQQAADDRFLAQLGLRRNVRNELEAIFALARKSDELLIMRGGKGFFKTRRALKYAKQALWRLGRLEWEVKQAIRHAASQTQGAQQPAPQPGPSGPNQQAQPRRRGFFAGVWSLMLLPVRAVRGTVSAAVSYPMVAASVLAVLAVLVASGRSMVQFLPPLAVVVTHWQMALAAVMLLVALGLVAARVVRRRTANPPAAPVPAPPPAPARPPLYRRLFGGLRRIVLRVASAAWRFICLPARMVRHAWSAAVSHQLVTAGILAVVGVLVAGRGLIPWSHLSLYRLPLTVVATHWPTGLAGVMLVVALGLVIVRILRRRTANPPAAPAGPRWYRRWFAELRRVVVGVASAVWRFICLPYRGAARAVSAVRSTPPHVTVGVLAVLGVVLTTSGVLAVLRPPLIVVIGTVAVLLGVAVLAATIILLVRMLRAGRPSSRPSPPVPPTGGNPVPTGGNPVPTGGNPVPTGGNPVPTGGNPVPTGGAPVPTGGNPVPTGGTTGARTAGGGIVAPPTGAPPVIGLTTPPPGGTAGAGGTTGTGGPGAGGTAGTGGTAGAGGTGGPGAGGTAGPVTGPPPLSPKEQRILKVALAAQAAGTPLTSKQRRVLARAAALGVAAP